jgi:hypothetical protein
MAGFLKNAERLSRRDQIADTQKTQATGISGISA